MVDEYGSFATLEEVIEESVGREIIGEFDSVIDLSEQVRQARQNMTDSAPE